jgi:hypothetical protein
MEAKLVQGLARGPWNSWTAEGLHSLGDLGFRHEARSVAELTVAARARAALQSEAYHRAIDLISTEPANDDDVRLFPTLPEWAASTAVMHMKAALDQLNSINDFDRARADDKAVLPTSVQALASKVLRRHRPHPWRRLLQRRIWRLVPEADVTTVELIIHNLHTAATAFPAFSIFATLKLLLNALPTARRMRGSDEPCLFCLYSGGDCIEHMLHCPAILAGYADVFPFVLRWSGPNLGGKRAALALDCSISECLAFVVANDLLVYAYSARKHGHLGRAAGLMNTRLRILRLRGVIENATP